MDSDVWYTWHDEHFDCDKYLYHYTNVEKASKILFNGSLRFSSIVNTNDTVEAKVKINFEGDEVKDFANKQQKINNYMKKYNEYMQLLCFCKDQEKDAPVYKKDNDLYFVDMMGRGFSLPRMWAQYADNNKGVCLIIDKSAFEKEFSRNMEVILQDDVEYKNVFSAFDMNSEIIEALYDSVCDDSETTMTGYIFAKRHLDYVRYSFFTKFLDWESEHEYRYLIGSDNKKLKEVKNLSKYLKGIVVGERIEDVQKWTIEGLAEKYKCNVKKICFDYDCCRLE